MKIPALNGISSIKTVYPIVRAPCYRDDINCNSIWDFARTTKSPDIQRRLLTSDNIMKFHNIFGIAHAL